MKLLTWMVLVILLILFEVTIKPFSMFQEHFLLNDPYLNITSDFVGLAKQNGYFAEEHTVVTEDGYTLLVHRIPYSPLSNITHKIRPVILLQPGALASSNYWILYSYKRSLPCSLADAGFDVWLGNARGNIYGQTHMKFSTADKEFWQFSYHEIAIYDVPAIIDYILNYTKSKELYFIGHSMGTTVSYVLLSMKPDYNEKIRLVVSLAPTAYWKKNLISPLSKFILTYSSILEVLLEFGKIYGIIPEATINKLLITICSNKSILEPLCVALFNSCFGSDPLQTKRFFNYYPSGGSLKIFYHYIQNIMAENFQNYDYGHENNMKRYKQKVPLEYNLTKVSAPVILMYAKNDALISEKFLLELYKRLPNISIFEVVPYDYFTHIDFITAIDVKKLLNDRIIDLLKQYSQ
ncbi:lipase 3 isoform X1 [Vespula squamosa]|uniref:Lipase n=1 Tax=Vespula squamosa TaxID=30214 RepID=A0ABD2A251_VESSQ